MRNRIEVKTVAEPPPGMVRTGVVEVMAPQRGSLRQRLTAARRAIDDAALNRLRIDVYAAPPEDL